MTIPKEKDENLLVGLSFVWSSLFCKKRPKGKSVCKRALLGTQLSALPLALNMRAGAGWFLRHGRPGNIINYFLLQMHPRQGTQTKGTGLLKALQPTMQHDGTIYGRTTPD